jgi:RimJ/RimL family protein N-acetyltransferase
MSRRVLPNEIPVDDRIHLRLPRRSDTAAMIAACQDPEIPRWTRVPTPYGQAEADAFFAMVQQRIDEGDEAKTYVIADTDDVLLGCVGLPRVEPEASCAELGYWLAAHARGHGYLTFAARAVLREALLVGYERISAEVLVGNDASCRVLERVGFSHEGILRSVAADGCGMATPRIDVHMYSVIRADPVASELLA